MRKVMSMPFAVGSGCAWIMVADMWGLLSMRRSAPLPGASKPHPSSVPESSGMGGSVKPMAVRQGALDPHSL